MCPCTILYYRYLVLITKRRRLPDVLSDMTQIEEASRLDVKGFSGHTVMVQFWYHLPEALSVLNTHITTIPPRT